MTNETIDDVIVKIAPGLLKHKGVVIFSAAMYLHKLFDNAEDIDLFFLNQREGILFRNYIIDELGAKELQELKQSCNGIYDSIFGRYELDGVEIEIMVNFKQRYKQTDHYFPIVSTLNVRKIKFQNGIDIPVATQYSLYKIYSTSPRLFDESLVHKRDGEKKEMLIPNAFNDLTVLRGESLKTIIIHEEIKINLIILQPFSRLSLQRNLLRL